MKTAEIYTKQNCPWCIKAKAILKKNDVQIIEYIIGVDGVDKHTIETKIGGGYQVKTVPQIFIDGKHIGGCTDLMKIMSM